MHPTLEKHHLKQVNRERNFSVGDVIKIYYKIKEGSKERIQVYEGTVIAIQNKGAGRSITVRRISYDVGVERIFPLYAPTIEKIEKIKSNHIRRGKLYYLREKIGKKGRLKEIKKKPSKDLFYEKAIVLQESIREKEEEKENQKIEETKSKQEQKTEEVKPK